MAYENITNEELLLLAESSYKYQKYDKCFDLCTELMRTKAPSVVVYMHCISLLHVSKKSGDFVDKQNDNALLIISALDKFYKNSTVKNENIKKYVTNIYTTLTILNIESILSKVKNKYKLKSKKKHAEIYNDSIYNIKKLKDFDFSFFALKPANELIKLSRASCEHLIVLIEQVSLNHYKSQDEDLEYKIVDFYERIISCHSLIEQNGVDFEPEAISDDPSIEDFDYDQSMYIDNEEPIADDYTIYETLKGDKKKPINKAKSKPTETDLVQDKKSDTLDITKTDEPIIDEPKVAETKTDETKVYKPNVYKKEEEKSESENDDEIYSSLKRSANKNPEFAMKDIDPDEYLSKAVDSVDEKISQLLGTSNLDNSIEEEPSNSISQRELDDAIYNSLKMLSMQSDTPNTTAKENTKSNNPPTVEPLEVIDETPNDENYSEIEDITESDLSNDSTENIDNLLAQDEVSDVMADLDENTDFDNLDEATKVLAALDEYADLSDKDEVSDVIEDLDANTALSNKDEVSDIMADLDECTDLNNEDKVFDVNVALDECTDLNDEDKVFDVNAALDECTNLNDLDKEKPKAHNKSENKKTRSSRFSDDSVLNDNNYYEGFDDNSSSFLDKISDKFSNIKGVDVAIIMISIFFIIVLGFLILTLINPDHLDSLINYFFN